MIYRSAKLFIQNNTNEIFTTEGFEVLTGKWSDRLAPWSGQTLPMQSTATWGSQSERVPQGTEGYIRLGCTLGYLQINWSRPWVGEFSLHIETPRGLSYSVQTNMEEPARPVALVYVEYHNARNQSQEEVKLLEASETVDEFTFVRDDDRKTKAETEDVKVEIIEKELILEEEKTEKNK